MNKSIKKGFCLVLAVGLIASTFAGCKKINYVTSGAIQAIHEIKDDSWTAQSEETDSSADTDETVLEKSFEANTYGGVEFKSIEDVVNYYVEAYNYTKSLTAQYKDDEGNTQTWYKLLGDEELSVGDVMIDGKSSSVVNAIVPDIVDGIFHSNTYGLVPCNNRNPLTDNSNGKEDDPGDYDFRTSYATADDVLDANVTDNGDGTITIQIQPKAAEMSQRGQDSQGRFFEVLGDISGVVADIKQISFTQGDATDNVKVTYKGGTVTVKIDTATKEITEADYHMVAEVSVTHANVLVIKDKSANITVTYDNHYPASDEWLLSEKGITRL